MMMNVVSSWIKNNVMEIEIINLIFTFHFQARFHAVEIFLDRVKIPARMWVNFQFKPRFQQTFFLLWVKQLYNEIQKLKKQTLKTQFSNHFWHVFGNSRQVQTIQLQ